MSSLSSVLSNMLQLYVPDVPSLPVISVSFPKISIGSRTPASGQKSPANAHRRDETVDLWETGSYLLLIAEIRFTARLLAFSSTHKLTNRIWNLSNRICNQSTANHWL